jgi:hypothetical protein
VLLLLLLLLLLLHYVDCVLCCDRMCGLLLC